MHACDSVNKKKYTTLWPSGSLTVFKMYICTQLDVNSLTFVCQAIIVKIMLHMHLNVVPMTFCVPDHHLQMDTIHHHYNDTTSCYMQYSSQNQLLTIISNRTSLRMYIDLPT